ncbi:hypothetical protein HX100_10550 [Thiopseudomonas alkaliphila]|nr:hypothetical protein [Thiopseudomonas alkaliphila]
MESCYRPISWPMFRRSDGNTSISPENIAGQSLSVGFRPLPQTTPASRDMVRGNRNSKVYHLSNCPSYDAMAERNRVLFNSESEAKSAGFRKAKNCPN